MYAINHINEARLQKICSLVLLFFFFNTYAQNNNINRFIQKIDESKKGEFSCRFQQNVSIKGFTEEDTIQKKIQTIYSIKNGKQWLKREDDLRIMITYPDSMRFQYYKPDSTVYERKENAWEDAYLPIFKNYIYQTQEISIDRLDTLKDAYRLTYHFYTDSTTLFSSARAITTFRKSDLFPVCHETFIEFQGMWQYEKTELSHVQKMKPDEKWFVLDKKLPVKKMVNCQEGRVIADFSAYENKQFELPVLKTLNAGNIDIKSNTPKLLIFDCFYVSCLPCRKAVPALNQVHQKFKNKGVLVAGIDNVDNDSSRVLKFIETLNVQYPVSVKAQSVNMQFPVTSYPTILIFDTGGHFLKGIIGYHDQLARELEEFIKEKIK